MWGQLWRGTVCWAEIQAIKTQQHCLSQSEQIHVPVCHHSKIPLCTTRSSVCLNKSLCLLSGKAVALV